MTAKIKHSLPILGPDQSMAGYLAEIQKFPILSREEEYELATDWVKNHTRAAGEQLVASHLRLVVSMAYELKDYGMPLAELIQSGNMGLMEALQKFDPEKGFRFSTYATFWIRAEMYNMILDNWSIMKIGRGAAQKKLFFNLTRAKRALGIMDAGITDADAAEIAKDLEVRPSDVIKMNERMSARDLSLNANKFEEGEHLDFLADNARPILDEIDEREQRIRVRESLQKNLAELPERDREILMARHLFDPPQTLEDLSQKYKISRERVRQIETRAMEKLKALMLAQEDKK